MPQASLADVLVYLRKICATQAARDLADGELLKRFVANRDESAFSILLQRHGPAVLSVCRRVLGDEHGAEDAFQAVFLVLVRRAASLAGNKPLGGWLYTVAQRVAAKARRQAIAQRERERRAPDMTRSDYLDDAEWQELRLILDEEVAMLPEKHRTPLVLCYFEGKSHAKAAKELGCPVTTLTKRLERGRELLRTRLVRRGITLSAGALTMVLSEKAGGTALGAMLAIRTVKAAMSLAAGKAAVAGCVSAAALKLAQEAMTGGMAMKGTLVLLVLACGVAVSGLGIAGVGGPSDPSGASVPTKMAQPITESDKGGIVRKTAQVATDPHGDPLPPGAVVRLGTIRLRHEGEATDLALSTDGKILVGSTLSGVIAWDTATGKEMYRLPRGAVAIGSKGGILATEGDGKICLRDIQTGKISESRDLPKLDSLSRVAWINLRLSPDEKSVILIMSTDVAVLDFVSGKTRSAFHTNGTHIYDAALSPDGKTLALASARPGVQLWDITTATMIRGIEHSKNVFVHAVAFSPDGKTIASGGSGVGDEVMLSDVATGKVQVHFKENDVVMGLGFAPDNKTLVSATQDGTIHVYDLASGTQRYAIESRTGVVRSMALSADGSTVALGLAGKAVRLWSIRTGKELLSDLVGHHSEVRSLAFTPDGKSLVSGEQYKTTHVWDTETWKLMRSLPGRGSEMAFSPDGKRLASIAANKTVCLWDFSAGKEEMLITGADFDPIVSAKFIDSGRKLVTLEIKPTVGKKGGLVALDMKADTEGPQAQGHLRQWDLQTGKEEQKWIIPDLFNRSLLAPDGMSAIGTRGRNIQLLNPKSGRSRSFASVAANGMRPLAVSADSRLLVSADIGQAAVVRLWETETSKEWLALKGHECAVTAAALSPDGRILATGDDNYLNGRNANATPGVRLWDIATGKELARFDGFGTSVFSLAFTPDGSRVAAGLEDSTILVWDVPKAARKTTHAEIQLKVDELQSQWAALGDKDASTNYHAIWTLVAAAKQSRSFLSQRLKPVAVADPVKIEQWIADLDGEKFAIRQAASKELEKVGDQARMPVQKALQRDVTLETRRRLEAVLKTLADVPGPETLRTLRAIMVLERIGSPEARVVLQELADGAPGARETEEAWAALARLDKQ